MKKINTTNIAGVVKAPFIKPTHDHYKEAIQETTASIVKGLIGSYTTNDVVILHGCVVTGTIPGTSAITAGSVFYNGEEYEVDANASISSGGGETLVWQIITTYIASDVSLKWSDGTIRDLHQIDKMQLVGAVSGSGLANYNAATVKNANLSKHSFPSESEVFTNTFPVVSVGSDFSVIDSFVAAEIHGSMITLCGVLRAQVTTTFSTFETAELTLQPIFKGKIPATPFKTGTASVVIGTTKIVVVEIGVSGDQLSLRINPAGAALVALDELDIMFNLTYRRF